MVGRTNVGGGGGGSSSSNYAYAQVTFPAGSTCTATNGSKTLTSPVTTGLYVFELPTPSSTPESWTFSCTSGSDTASSSISITGKYQFEAIELAFGVPTTTYTTLKGLKTNYSDSASTYVDTGMSPPSANEQIQITFDPFQGIHGTDGIVLYGGSYNFYIGYGYLNWKGAKVGSNFYTSSSGECVLTINNANHQVICVEGSRTTTLGTVSGASSTSTANVVLFSNANSTADVTIRGYKRSNNTTGTLLQDFVPCQRKSDNVYGFYDLVSKTFYPVVGTNISGEALS